MHDRNSVVTFPADSAWPSSTRPVSKSSSVPTFSTDDATLYSIPDVNKKRNGKPDDTEQTATYINNNTRPSLADGGDAPPPEVKETGMEPKPTPPPPPQSAPPEERYSSPVTSTVISGYHGDRESPDEGGEYGDDEDLYYNTMAGLASRINTEVDDDTEVTDNDIYTTYD